MTNQTVRKQLGRALLPPTDQGKVAHSPCCRQGHLGSNIPGEPGATSLGEKLLLSQGLGRGIMDTEVRARLLMDKWLCGFAGIERTEPLEEEKHPLNSELWF